MELPQRLLSPLQPVADGVVPAAVAVLPVEPAELVPLAAVAVVAPAEAGLVVLLADSSKAENQQ